MKPGVSVELDPELAEKLTALQDEGFEIWRRFDIEVRQHEWHPFVPVEYHEKVVGLVYVAAMMPSNRADFWVTAICCTLSSIMRRKQRCKRK